jgi:hypothetical protein
MWFYFYWFYFKYSRYHVGGLSFELGALEMGETAGSLPHHHLLFLVWDKQDKRPAHILRQHLSLIRF